ncbi:MAG TPA: phage holin family protein [Acidimicrobiales bacterium]|nr:phage holin family protein [Acidimicrobiales bacterium]
MSPERPPDRDERPLSELLSDVTTQLQTLMRKEMELARTEVKQELTKAAKGAAAFAVAGVVGFLAAIALVFAAAWGLTEIVPEGVAFLIVGVLLLAVAGILGNEGRKKMAEVSPVPERTVETVKEDVQTAKEAVKRGTQETPDSSASSDYHERWRRY